MRHCHLLPRCEGVLGLGHLVVFLFGQCITYCNNGLNGFLGSRYFLYVINERTSFASSASVFESSRQVIGLKRTSDQKVAYVSFKASVTETKSQGQHMERRHLKWVATNKS